MSMIRREFTAERPRRLGTLARRWADPEPEPEPVAEEQEPAEPEQQEPEPPAGGQEPPAGTPPVIAWKPEAARPGETVLPGAPDPRQVARNALLGSLGRREPRVRPDNL